MKKLISFLIILATLFSICAFTASAAEEEFISEVALIYEDSVDAALNKIEGTGWKLFAQNLNAGADYWFNDGVYLIYKTSTNVEDAITDLRVMDMYGGFSLSNYERELEKSRQEYLDMCWDIRTAATEFKALYEAGDRMAALAYRQMNYYKDLGETNKLMGDFMLNIPSDDALVTVMLEGNAIVVSNLISLLAIGLANEEHSLADRVAELYEVRNTLTDEDYYDDAVVLNESLKSLAAKIKRYDTLQEKYKLYDEEMGEEEYNFVKEVAAVALLAESIKLGDVTLAGLLRQGSWSLTDIYPLVAAFSQGQMGLIKMGAFELTLKHATPSNSVDALYEVVEEMEKKMMDENGNIELVDVYIGVDRSIFEGTFAMTNEAERQQALTGETWDFESAISKSMDLYKVASMLIFLDLVAWGCFAYTLPSVPAGVSFYQITYTISVDLWVPEGAGVFSLEGTVTSSGVSSAGIWFWTAAGIALIVIGLVGISTWYNYYNPEYTEIPNTMIDIRETSLGDKYVRYTAAKVFGDEEKNADFNAYEGKEWNALYYTKDATAGNCLTPNFVFKDNDSSVARRHQGISMFGEDKAFNLNSHVYDSDAKGAYVTVRYSTTKKEAADLPTVVGSMLTTGALYAVTAIGGMGVGVGATLLVNKARKKKDACAEQDGADSI